MRPFIRFSLLMILSGWYTLGLSQTTQTIYLKDGSVIKGDIVEDSDYRVRIVIASGDTLTIGYKYVHSIDDTSEEIDEVFRGKRKLTPLTHLNKGRIIALSLGVTLSEYDDAGFQTSLDIGKRLNHKLHLGGGLSYHRFVQSFQFIYLEHDFFSIHAYGRYYFNEENIRFYGMAKLGYGIAGSNQFSRDFSPEYYDEYTGGITSQLAIGAHFASREKFRFFAELNLSHQKANGSYGAWDWQTNMPITADYDINYIRPGLSVGIEF